MAVCLINKSGGGVSSDDVTAKREHVLQGYTALTSDSNDEPAQGTIPNRGNGTNVLELVNSAGESKLYARIDEGYYSKNGQYKPAVAIPYAVLAQSIGINESKMLDDYTVAGTRGAIPRWIATHGDVIIANQSHSGQGFAYDLPGVGRCIVTGIKNESYIHGANYVALPSPNFQPWNIRKNVNMNGIIGTMEDYGAGRVAFRNATFDGVLISGVANIGLGDNLNVYSKPSTEIRDGIIKFYNGGSVSGGGLHQYRSNTVLEEAVTLAHSVNLTPFRTIRLGLKYPYGGRWGTVGGVGSLVGVLWALPTNITPEYVPSRNAKINPNVIKRVGYKDGVIPATQGQWNTPTEIPTGAEYFVDIDVSDLQGHHRMVLGIAVSEANHRENFTIQVIVYVNNGISGISHIEFIN